MQLSYDAIQENLINITMVFGEHDFFLVRLMGVRGEWAHSCKFVGSNPDHCVDELTNPPLNHCITPPGHRRGTRVMQKIMNF